MKWKQKGFRLSALLLLGFCWLLRAPGLPALAAGPESELAEKSGAGDLWSALPEEARELMDRAGGDDEGLLTAPDWQGLLSALSSLFREKLTAPLRALATLTAVIVLCRLADSLELTETGTVTSLAAALACAVTVAAPLLSLLSRAEETSRSASVFLLAAAPVYAALLAAGGSPSAGASYSYLVLAAGNAIPALCSLMIFPLLHAFLLLAVTAAASQVKWTGLADSLYRFLKWLLVLAVTVFSVVLSIQTVLSTQVDAAAGKAAKFMTSTVPIVGGAFGDAVAVILNSIRLLRSGVGAFGILAAVCIFAPLLAECALWVAVCGVGRLIGELFQASGVSTLLGMCAEAGRMVLAVAASICIVCVVTAGLLVFAGGGL